MNILIAGMGNVFYGDDGFGVAVVQRLARQACPSGVRVRDFGIRGLDLGYELLDGIEAALLVDAIQQGGAPGSLYLIEPDITGSESAADESLTISPHGMNPYQVLCWASRLAPARTRVALVGCEPESFGTENDGEGRMGLSAPVEAAIPQAVGLINEWIQQMIATGAHHEERHDMA